MKTQNPIPAYVPTTRTPRAWTKGRTAAANLIRGIQRKRQPRPRWPAGSGDTTGLQHSADANRLWHSDLYFAWQNTIGATERAAYEAAAATFTIKNNKGANKTPNGFQLFVWWNSFTAGDTWSPPYPWAFYPDFWDDVPPDASWPKPAPIGLVLVDSTPPYLTVDFSNDLDLANYYAFLQLTNTANPGEQTPTSHWHRLGPLPINSTATHTFQPSFTGSTVVPPWTSTPNYVPADWYMAANGIIPRAPSTNESIRAGFSCDTYQIYGSAAVTYYFQIDAPLWTWGILPTGARLALVLKFIDPSTGLPYADGHPRFIVYQHVNWTDAGTAVTTPLVWTTFTSALQNYSITRDHTTDTITTPAGVITLPNGGSLPNTDVGIDGGTHRDPVPPHNILLVAIFKAYRVYGPLHLWTVTANYQAIIENPAKPGPRGLRLTLGANYEVNMLHSDWISTTISL